MVSITSQLQGRHGSWLMDTPRKCFRVHTPSKTWGYGFLHLSSTPCHTWDYR